MAVLVESIEEVRTQALPLLFRADFLPSSLDEKARTVEIVLSTGVGVERYDWMSGERYIEELSLEQAHVRLDRLNAGAPLLDSHWGGSVLHQLGVIVPGSARIADEGGKRELRAQAKFSENPAGEQVWKDVRAGIVRNVSIGYRVYRKVLVEKAENALPRYRCEDWEPFEGSMVTIPADFVGGTRSMSGSGHERPEPNPCVLVRAVTPMVIKTPDAPVNEPATTDTRALEIAAETREAERQAETRRLCRKHKFDDTFADGLLAKRVDGRPIPLDQVRTEVLAELEKRETTTATNSQHSGSIQVGTPDKEKFARVLADALIAKGGVFTDATRSAEVKSHDQLTHRNWLEQRAPLSDAQGFMGMRLSRVAELLMRRNGIDTSLMSEMDIIERAIAPGVGSADFANVVKIAAEKSLRLGYTESPRTFMPWSRRTFHNDFRGKLVVGLSSAADLKKIPANGEISYVALGDTGQTYAVASYGTIVAITRVVMINDNADVFSKLTYMLGQAGNRLESDTVYALLTSGQLMDEDGLAIYNAAHNNTGTGVIDVAGIQSGYTAMSVQRAKAATGVTGPILNLIPRFLLVPTSRYAVAQQYTAPINAQAPSSVNPFGSASMVPLTPIAEPRLNAASTAQWHLIADPGQIDTCEVATLAGQDGMYMEQRIGFERDGIEIKSRHDFGAALIDFRGFYRSSGS